MEKDLQVLEGHFVALESLEAFHQKLRSQGNLTPVLAMESERVLGHSRLLNTVGVAQSREIAMESILDATKSVISRIYTTLLEMIQKLIAWFKERFTKAGKFQGTPEQVKQITLLLADPELQRSCGEVFSSAEFKAMQEGKVLDEKVVGQEDFRIAPADKLQEIYSKFKESLSDRETDFITAGKYFHTIAQTVQDYSRMRFSDFIAAMENDINSWGDDGLAKAPFVGKNELVADDWLTKQRVEMRKIRERHSVQLSKLSDLSERANQTPVEPNTSRLLQYYKQPSTLFPQLERNWKQAGFENLNTDDRRLAQTLEEVAKRFKTLADNPPDTKDWPAYDGMAKLIAQVHREAMRDVQRLMQVANFIQNSADTAYQGTLKSFAYLMRILTVVSVSPGADKPAIAKVIETLRDRQKTLTELVKH